MGVVTAIAYFIAYLFDFFPGVRFIDDFKCERQDEIILYEDVPFHYWYNIFNKML